MLFSCISRVFLKIKSNPKSMSAEPRSLDLLHFLQLLPHRTAISSIVRMSPRHDLRGRYGVVLNRQAFKIPIGFIVVPFGGLYRIL